MEYELQTYDLLEKNDEEGWAKISVELPDGSTYQKRMMVDLTNLDAMNMQIKIWYNQYCIDIANIANADVDPQIEENIGTTVTITDPINP